MSLFYPRGSSLLAVPAGGGTFSIPTPPTSSTASVVPLNPNLTAGPSGLDTYRPWRPVVLDGELFICNGWDTPRRWDRTNGVWSYMGSAAPTDFGALSLTGAPGTAIPTGQTARYYLVGYNSTLNKETAPQGGGDVTIANASGITKDVVIPWTAGSLPVEFDKRRIYRALNLTDDYHLVAEVADATATYTDTTADATLRTNGSRSWDGTIRTTLPFAWEGMAEDQGICFAWLRGQDSLYYTRGVRTVGTYIADDFNLVPIVIGADEGTGSPTAYVALNGSAVIWKRGAIYEKTGDSIANWAIRTLTTARGTFNPKTVVALPNYFLCLDELGIYRLSGSMSAGMVGSIEEMYHAPMQPIIDRLNLSAANTFESTHLETLGIVVFWVALDHDPTPGHGIVFNYGKGRFEGLVTRRYPTATGFLRDATGTRHPCFGDDMGRLWEMNYAESEGVFAGSNTGTRTAGSGLTVTCGAASFDTTEPAGAPGSPMERYDSTGSVVDENRVYSATSTALTTYLYPTTAQASGDTVAIGVIPALLETGMFAFATHEAKFVHEIYLEYESGVSGSVRVDTAMDDDDFVLKWEQSLATGVRDLIPTANATSKNWDRCWYWRLRVSQRYANLGFSLRAIHVRWSYILGKRQQV